MTATFLTNQFLIAMPGMADPNFAQTVTLVCEHNAQGALGIVINRPLPMTFGDVFKQLGLDAAAVGIVRLASPFDPFPPAMRERYPLLRFAYEWQFLKGHLGSGAVLTPAP